MQTLKQIFKLSLIAFTFIFLTQTVWAISMIMKSETEKPVIQKPRKPKLKKPSAIKEKPSEKPLPIRIKEPWFTGSLLSPSGVVIPKGHLNIEPYFFLTNIYGAYDHSWRPISTPSTTALASDVLIFYGLTNSMDMTLDLPYYRYARTLGQSSTGNGDASIDLGFQLLRVKMNSWIPNIQLAIGEIFPTGNYRNLNPQKLQTDAFGEGAYRTTVALDFETLDYLKNGKFLDTRLSFIDAFPSHTNVRGFNAYGGGIGTKGTVNLKNALTINLAFEYSLTQHWVPVIDFNYATSGSANFRGMPGFLPGGSIATNNQPSSAVVSTAPAIEYNFSPNLGVIAGTWFSLAGRNAGRFVSGVVAINFYY